jgi:tRNA U38,U39,U40 pseudouridine synthase TruA
MNGVNQLTCPTCHKKYVGQTSRQFHVRFQEHYRDYKYANNISKFAQHVIEEGHALGPMNDIMDVLHVASKGTMLDTLERFHIYKETKLGTQISDKLTVQSNPIFEALIQNDPHRGQ